MKNLIFIVTAVAFLSAYASSTACTNLIVTKGASSNNSNMITYAADAGGFMEPLFYSSAADHPEGSMIDIYDWDTGKFLGKIKQARHTYRVVGNMNEFQVTIGETTFGGLDSLRDTTGIIDYGSLIRLALQRSTTAREAIRVIDELTKEYGYYSSGESFSIGDANEIWIMDIHPKGTGDKGLAWVARRIPDGHIAAHANQSRIREILKNDPDNCMHSAGLEEFAKKKGIYKEFKGKFSYADTFNPLEPGGVLYCEGRVWRFYSLAAPSQNLSEDYFRAVKDADPYPLFIKPDKKIGVKDLMNWMRDHFEGTDFDLTQGLAAGPYGCPVRYKGLEWKLEGDSLTTYGWERPIGTQQTAWSFIAQMRAGVPDEIGGVLWYGVDHAATSCYVPLYSCLKEAPKPFRSANIAEFDWESAAWVFNLVSNRSYMMYKFIVKDIQAVQQPFEDRELAAQEYIETAAKEMYKKDRQMAVDYLSDYSSGQAQMAYEKWLDLWKFITVKYNDGYINDVTKNNGRSPKGPGYDQEFLKQVVGSRPGYYDVKWKTGTN